MPLILFFFGLHEFSAKALIVFFCSFLYPLFDCFSEKRMNFVCLFKETNQRKDTTPYQVRGRLKLSNFAFALSPH